MQSIDRKKYRRKVNIPMCAASILLCLVLFSTYFMSGIFARYTTSMAVSGSARVAKFDTKLTSQPGELTFTPAWNGTKYAADSETFTLSIKNDSEAAVRYAIRLVFANASANGCIKVTNTGAALDDDSIWVIPGGTLASGTSATVDVTFSFDPDAFAKGYTPEGENGSLKTGETTFDFNTFVTFTQID